MSLFDFPRINFHGTIKLNPGTANNDDYAGAYFFPKSWGPFAGATLGLIDSKMVQARTFGMSDEAFIEWVQQEQSFSTNASGEPENAKTFPAEWNYYGDMSSQANVKVVGVQTGPDQIYTKEDTSVPLSQWLGMTLSFNGNMADVNSEGSPPATQFFIQEVDWQQGDMKIQGSPSKGACQWINFFRNVNLTADAGAGGYIYHVIPCKDGDLQVLGFENKEGKKLAGVILRYYLYATQSSRNMGELYPKGLPNPAITEIVGTIAPWYEDEQIITGPEGRLMVSDLSNIKTPTDNNNGKGKIALAPAVLHQSGDQIAVDFSGTFPENFQDATSNPKFDFGEVNLVATDGSAEAVVGAVPYQDTDGGNQKGWLFDFDISCNKEVQAILGTDNATFFLKHTPSDGQPAEVVLQETDYYFMSNQQGIYAEQGGTGRLFVNQGYPVEPATVRVFHRGQELIDDCPPITVWEYRSTPLQDPGNGKALYTDFKPGQALEVDTDQPGNFLLTFTINNAQNQAPSGYPPQNYGTFSFPPYVTNFPSMSLRILPNEEDFSAYYIDPISPEPTGNALLTFDVVYEKVLRVYYLLYPAMNKIIALNSEEQVAKYADAFIRVTEDSFWMSTGYMPKTRDLSRNRRNLLRAWCRKVLLEK